MLLVAAFALLGRVAAGAPRRQRAVAVATVICTALYPVFFAQSSLAHLDMMAAALTLWGLAMYVERRHVRPLCLLRARAAGERNGADHAARASAPGSCCVRCCELARSRASRCVCDPASRLRSCWPGCSARFPWRCWLAYHQHVTGYFFGNPEYLRYNLAATLNPLRMVLAMLIRLWHLLGYLNLFVLTLGAAYAMFRPALLERDGTERPRIAINVQLVFAVVILGVRRRVLRRRRRGAGALHASGLSARHSDLRLDAAAARSSLDVVDRRGVCGCSSSRCSFRRRIASRRKTRCCIATTLSLHKVAAERSLQPLSRQAACSPRGLPPTN